MRTPSDSQQNFKTATSHMKRSLLLRFGIRNLVNDKSHAALRDDVGNAVAQLDADNGFRWIKVEHWKQVHNWVGAPTNARHYLRSTDLSRNDWVFFTFSGRSKSDKELVHNIQEETHRQEPTYPSWRQVTRDNKLTVIARHDHKSRADAKGPSSRIEVLVIKLHHEKDFDQKQRNRQQPVHVTVGVIERYPC